MVLFKNVHLYIFMLVYKWCLSKMPSYIFRLIDFICNCERQCALYFLCFYMYVCVDLTEEEGTCKQRSGKGTIRKKIPTPKTKVGKKLN